MINVQPGQVWTEMQFTSKSRNYVVTSSSLYLHDENKPDAIPMVVYRSDDCRYANSMSKDKFVKEFRLVHQGN